MTEFHWIRPWWLLTYLPLLGLFLVFLRQTIQKSSWNAVCDAHLLPYLIQNSSYYKRSYALAPFFLSLSLMIFSLSGPAWVRLPVPTYTSLQPRVLVLDMSESMSEKDMPPDRLTRAKFKLHDILTHKNSGQLGLIIYSGEPFVVSPLTEDGATIDALLPSLTMDVMPVSGHRLDLALEEAEKLIVQAGFTQGEILVLTSEAPTKEAIHQAQQLDKKGIHTSVVPLRAQPQDTQDFETLAEAGGGLWIPFTDTAQDIERWLNEPQFLSFNKIDQKKIPAWRDEGRWFLIPALLCLLPLFRRGALQGILP